jgi:site-specific DNA-methyltransferase (adenine-specific)
MRVNDIYNMDCLEGMKEIADGSVDMVLCDLPYGTTQNKWDSVISLQALWREYTRVCKQGAAVVLTTQMPFTSAVVVSNLPWFKYEWIWEKNVATGHLNSNVAPMKKHENILVFANGKVPYYPQMMQGKPYSMKRKPVNDNGSNYGTIVRTDTVNEGQRFPVSVLQFNRETGLHPTQKPVALFEYLIRTYTNPGQLVLDNCMGSGTTAIACINTGRQYIGFESDPGYFRIAQDRVQKHVSNQER